MSFGGKSLSVLSISLTICFSNIPSAVFPVYGKQRQVSPTVGEYSFSPRGCFNVREDVRIGRKHVYFASNCYSYHKARVKKNGHFRKQWGQFGGTHCPTDGFVIKGRFQSETLARGRVAYMFDCRITSVRKFTAEFVEENTTTTSTIGTTSTTSTTSTTNTSTTTTTLPVVIWEELSVPTIEGDYSSGPLPKIAAIDGRIMLLIESVLLRSDDFGQSWHVLDDYILPKPPFDSLNYLSTLDVDGDNFYVLSRNALYMSEDYGDSFEWLFGWKWDPITDVDFQDGYGWLTIANWGSRSGPNRLTSNGSWEVVEAGISHHHSNMGLVVIDTLQPDKIVYVAGSSSTYVRYPNRYRTLNGGELWEPIEHVVSFATQLNGTSLILGRTHYSTDHGTTWALHGAGEIKPYAFAKDSIADTLYVSNYDDVVWRGVPGSWEPYGPSGQLREYEGIASLTFVQGYIFAATSKGRVFRIKTDQ